MNRIKLAAAAVLTSAVVVGSVGPTALVDAAPADIPWFERPATVGTGFRLGEGATSVNGAVVSASGRWVAFSSNATNLLAADPAAGAFLRDRWTDTTFRLATTPAGEVWIPKRMSHDGRFVVGHHANSDGTINEEVIFDQRNRRSVRVPAPPGQTSSSILGINNDGYFIAVDGSPNASGAHLNRAGRILDDGTIQRLGVTAKGSRQFDDLTPSLQYALTTRDVGTAPWGTLGDPLRIDLTTGTMVSFADTFPTASGRFSRIRSTGISPNGRFVAMTVQLPIGFAVRVWDVTNHTFADHTVADGEDGRDPVVRSVLDDGRIIYGTVTNNVYFADPIGHPEHPARLLSVKFDDGSPVRVQYNDQFRASSQIASDIDRVLLCPSDPMSSFSPAYQDHCYLKPFPPSPLAG